MKRHLTLAILLLAALALPVMQPPPAAAQTGPAAEVLRLVNELRATQGLPPFQLNGALTSAAQGHAEWMAANVSYTHTGAGGSRPQDRANAAGYSGYVSENIVGGTSMTPARGVEWWRNSGIHYRTMTSTRYSQAGVGSAPIASGGNMYVLVVGQPTGAPVPAPAEQTQPGGQSSAPPPAQPVVVIPVEVSEPREDGSVVHVIQSGQTAWDVAAVYDVDLVALLELNNLPDNPILFPWDEIVVVPPDRSTNPAEPLIHTVRLGDTAWSLAARYHVELETLLWYNSLGPDAILQPGDELIIQLGEGQEPPPTPTPPTTHVVQPGETAWTIAARYGLTLADLLNLNDLPDNPVLLPGDVLLIQPAGPTRIPAISPTPTATFTELPPPTESGETPSETPSATASPTASVLLPTAAIRAATMTPTPALLPEEGGGGPNTLVTIGLVIGIGLAALAVGAAVIGNLLERRRGG